MKKLLKYILCLASLSLEEGWDEVYAQNLVPNYSFEIYDTCPYHSNQIFFAAPWQGITTSSTDYFNACGSGGATVPQCGGGWQYARTGVAYAGIWVINSYGFNYREYLQVKLENALELDSCYSVEFYCNLHNSSGYCINKMGAYLSNNAVSTVGPLPNGTVLQYTPQIISNIFLNDSLNWMRVGGYYKANGGEQYITVGNFNTDSTTDTLHVGGSYPDGSYYLIDDITIKKVAGCDTITSIKDNTNGISFNLYPNPNNGQMLLSNNLKADDKAQLLIYDIAGKLIYKPTMDISTNQMIIRNEKLNSGIYFYQIKVNEKIVKSDKLVIIKESN